MAACEFVSFFSSLFLFLYFIFFVCNFFADFNLFSRLCFCLCLSWPGLFRIQNEEIPAYRDESARRECRVMPDARVKGHISRQRETQIHKKVESVNGVYVSYERV